MNRAKHRTPLPHICKNNIKTLQNKSHSLPSKANQRERKKIKHHKAEISHLRLASVGVKNPHGIVSAVDARHGEDDSVGADSEVPIAQLHCLLRCDPRLRRIPIINLIKFQKRYSNQKPACLTH